MHKGIKKYLTTFNKDIPNDEITQNFLYIISEKYFNNKKEKYEEKIAAHKTIEYLQTINDKIKNLSKEQKYSKLNKILCKITTNQKPQLEPYLSSPF